MKQEKPFKPKMPFGLTILLIGLLISTGYAQTETQVANLAKESQNPVSSLISLPFQFNFNFGMGEYNRSQTVLNIQPVIPVKLTSKINLINRFILPVLDKILLHGDGGDSLFPQIFLALPVTQHRQTQ
jgi:hypothetical protein